MHRLSQIKLVGILAALLPAVACSQLPKTDVYPTQTYEERITADLRAVAPNAKLNWDVEKHRVFFSGVFTKPESGPVEEVAARFLQRYSLPVHQRPSVSEMQVSGTSIDQFGVTHVTFQQSYRSIPVWGKRIKVHLDKERRVVGVSGNYVPNNLDLNENPSIDKDRAFAIATKNSKGESLLVSGPELVIFELRSVHYLAWNLVVEGHTDEVDEALWNYFVDARSGKVLFRFNRINTQGVATVGSGLGCQTETLSLQVVNEDDERFFLQDATRRPSGGGDVFTRDGKSKTSQDPDGVWENTNISPRSDSQQPEAAIHFWLGRSYDLLKELTGRESYDGAGHDVIAAAHTGLLNNATWGGKLLKFGDGDGTEFGYWGCANDVVSHEFMHAVTEHTAGLEYLFESGALNEAYSDIFGAMLDREDWLVGEDLYVDGDNALRDMGDPTRGGVYDSTDSIEEIFDKNFPQPNRYQDLYITNFDAGGVHINSGIYNHAFYLMAEGDVETETGSGHRCHPGIGREVTWSIFFPVLTNYLGPTASLFEAGSAIEVVAEMAITDDPFARLVVEDSLKATGIGGEFDRLTCFEAASWLVN